MPGKPDNFSNTRINDGALTGWHKLTIDYTSGPVSRVVILLDGQEIQRCDLLASPSLGFVRFRCDGQNTSVGQAYLDDITVEPLVRVDLTKAVKPTFSGLTLTTNYQLQISSDMNTWINYGSPFTATNTVMAYPQYWDVDDWGRLFFQLRMVP